MESAPDQPTLVWHAYPLGLSGADQTGRDRRARRTLADLTTWLPHVEALGCDTILLGPVFDSLSHGYDTVDHRRVDERLGDDADLDELIAAAEARNIGLVLDGAFAYASREFWRLHDPAEASAPWFQRDDAGELVAWRVDSLVTPNYSSAGYRNYVAEVMTHWLGRGVAGWRLDSAWSVPDRLWREVLARVRRSSPRAWLLGQIFDDDLPAAINSATYSSATEYSVMHGLREWLPGGPATNMMSTLRVHAQNSMRCPVHTFVGNHDFARLADVVGGQGCSSAFAVLLTLPGVPAVYYGDEFGLTSTWTDGGGDAVLRPALQIDDGAVTDPRAQAISTRVGQLGRFRRARPWLTSAQLSEVRVEGDELSYRVSGPEDSIEVTLDRRTGRGAIQGQDTVLVFD